MPYGVVLKDERPTSNIERRIMMSLCSLNYFEPQNIEVKNIDLFL